MYYQKTQPNKETEFRLNVWKHRLFGMNIEWIKRGIDDATKYFYESNGELELLKLSYNWDWLDNRFIKQGYHTIE